MAGLVWGSLVGLPRMVISFAGEMVRGVQFSCGVCAIIPEDIADDILGFSARRVRDMVQAMRGYKG